MTPAFALVILGGVLVVAGWSNRNVIDVLLGREEENPKGRAPKANPNPSGGVSLTPDDPNFWNPVEALKGLGGKGKRVARFYGGDHTDHVHVAAPKHLLANLMKEAQRRGLTITSTTGGTHAPNSFHYRGLAFDADGGAEKNAAFANYVAQTHGGSVYELFWDGPRWVNIDNK